MTLDEFLENSEEGQKTIMEKLEAKTAEEAVERWNKICKVDGAGEEYIVFDRFTVDQLDNL